MYIHRPLPTPSAKRAIQIQIAMDNVAAPGQIGLEFHVSRQQLARCRTQAPIRQTKLKVHRPVLCASSFRAQPSKAAVKAAQRNQGRVACSHHGTSPPLVLRDRSLYTLRNRVLRVCYSREDRSARHTPCIGPYLHTSGG